MAAEIETRDCAPAGLPPAEVMYRAVAQRDASFDGVFVVGVRTTGVFCRPGCGAKTPNRENVEFFARPHDALLAGYRPCRRCRPLEAWGTHPDWVAGVLELVERRPEERITAAELRAAGVEPARVARYFRRRFGMSFQAYVRSRRMASAVREIRAGRPVGQVAIRSGFESESGFRDAFRRLFGEAPTRVNGRGADVLTARWLPTPLGPMLAVACERGLCLLEFLDRRALPAQLRTLRRRVPGPVVPGESAHLSRLEAQLGEYFEGARRVFDLAIHAPGTPFQERVWEALRRIPFGVTRSYGEIARELGRPGAVRAVARANGMNRLAIVIPCHRVVGADGKLTGYGGGLWRKQRLLELERGMGE